MKLYLSDDVADTAQDSEGNTYVKEGNVWLEATELEEPSFSLKTLDLSDEATKREFLDNLREYGVPTGEPC